MRTAGTDCDAPYAGGGAAPPAAAPPDRRREQQSAPPGSGQRDGIRMRPPAWTGRPPAAKNKELSINKIMRRDHGQRQTQAGIRTLDSGWLPSGQSLTK